MAQSGVLWVPRIQLIRGFAHTMMTTDLSIGGQQTVAQVSFMAGRSIRWKLIPTLRLMDWVGNAHHGVVLPYNYWPEKHWRAAFDHIGLRVGQWQPRLAIYPWPFTVLFDRGLHFVASLDA
jgi:hypothetical protein